MADTDPIRAAPRDASDEASFPVGLVLSDRAFWGVFAGAWLAYSALYLSFGITQAETLAKTLLGTALNTGGPLVPALYVAARRRSLLRHDLSWGRFVAKLVLGGLVFAAVATAIIYALAGVFDFDLMASPEFDGDPWVLGMALFVSEYFIYVMLMGFLLFTESMRRVQETRELAAHEAVLRAQAEAKALRSQFNPHFVFNTLHSLMLLVRADPATAEKAIEDVAGLIRYASTLQRKEVDRVTLERELDFARRYISLEQLRLGDRLSIEWAIAEEALDLMVPSFSLQTLLENSIKHGISPRTSGGTVTITAALEGGDLVMTVADDGEGADPDEVGRDGGSGLELLGRRLQVVYGDAAELRWSTGAGAGFTTTVRLPAERQPRLDA